MTLQLPPFDRLATCAKCGTRALHHAEFHDERHGPRLSSTEVCPVREEMERNDVHDTLPEHLCRTCECCGYRWAEATVGAEPELPAHGGVWLEQRYLDTNHMAVTRCDPS